MSSSITLSALLGSVFQPRSWTFSSTLFNQSNSFCNPAWNCSSLCSAFTRPPRRLSISFRAASHLSRTAWTLALSNSLRSGSDLRMSSVLSFLGSISVWSISYRSRNKKEKEGFKHLSIYELIYLFIHSFIHFSVNEPASRTGALGNIGAKSW